MGILAGMSVRWLLVTCVIVMTSSGMTAPQADGREPSSDLKRSFIQMFSELDPYGSQFRPVNDLDERLDVRFLYNLWNIEDVDTENGILTVRAWYDWSWTDYYLHWNVDRFGIEYHRVSTRDIWIPDFKLVNGLEERVDDRPAMVKADGTVQLILPVTHRVQCEIRSSQRYVCGLLFLSWTYTADQLYMTDDSRLTTDSLYESDRVVNHTETSRVYTGKDGGRYLEVNLDLELRGGGGGMGGKGGN